MRRRISRSGAGLRRRRKPRRLSTRGRKKSVLPTFPGSRFPGSVRSICLIFIIVRGTHRKPAFLMRSCRFPQAEVRMLEGTVKQVEDAARSLLSADVKAQEAALREELEVRGGLGTSLN